MPQGKLGDLPSALPGSWLRASRRPDDHQQLAGRTHPTPEKGTPLFSWPKPDTVRPSTRETPAPRKGSACFLIPWVGEQRPEGPARGRWTPLGRTWRSWHVAGTRRAPSETHHDSQVCVGRTSRVHPGSWTRLLTRLLTPHPFLHLLSFEKWGTQPPWASLVQEVGDPRGRWECFWSQVGGS